MKFVVCKNYLEGQILYRSLVPPIKNGVIAISIKLRLSRHDQMEDYRNRIPAQCRFAVSIDYQCKMDGPQRNLFWTFSRVNIFQRFLHTLVLGYIFLYMIADRVLSSDNLVVILKPMEFFKSKKGHF